MGLNRYYGTLMYCTFLPVSIYATDEKEALEQLKKNAPEALNEAEKKELSFRLTRVPQADRVRIITKEPLNVQKTADETSLSKTAATGTLSDASPKSDKRSTAPKSARPRKVKV